MLLLHEVAKKGVVVVLIMALASFITSCSAGGGGGGGGSSGNPIFNNHLDAIYSSHGSIPDGAKAQFQDNSGYVQEIQPYHWGHWGYFDPAGNLINDFEVDLCSSNNAAKGVAVYVTQDGRRLIAIMYHGGCANGIHVRDADTGEGIAFVSIGSASYHYMIFSDDGRQLIVAQGDGSGHAGPETYLDIMTYFQRFSGVNLPWENYGADVGLSPWDGPVHIGFSSNLAQLNADFAYLANHGVKVVRVFLFSDFRTGLIYQDDGFGTLVAIYFDEYVYEDIDALISVAQAHDMLLIPVLLDFTVADGISEEGGVPVGEHPELLTDYKEMLATRLSQLVVHYGTASGTIIAWDIMSQPEYAVVLTIEELDEFFQLTLLRINQSALIDPPVTIGHSDRGEIGYWDIDSEVDTTQFHYYDFMEPWFPWDHPAYLVDPFRPVYIGEAEPTDVGYKLYTAQSNGYMGVIFWSLNAQDGYDFRLVADQYAAYFAQVVP